jgi:predicted XRE-type DNA-binding protein
LTRNIQSRVARVLHLSRSHVCLVANGHRKSARVEKALAKEYARIERVVQRFERHSDEVAA